jgi:hypothetical protein
VAQDLALARGELVELGSASRPVSVECPENASSTKPVRRGEKTASPACTRAIASSSSSVAMFLVT